MFGPPSPDFTACLINVPGGRAGAIATVARMRALVNEYRMREEILTRAVTTIYSTPQWNQWAEVNSLFEYVRGRIRYVKDIHGLETLADPVTTMARMVGDCDDKATLLASLCEAVGYPTRFVMGAYRSDEFEHVYLQILINGEWIDADPTLWEPLGYAAPDPRMTWTETVRV